MQPAPKKEVPPDAMPHATYQHGEHRRYHQIGHLSLPGFSFQQGPGSGEKDVITKPVRKADMPAFPEFGNAPGKIRQFEIIGKLDSKETTDAAHDACVTGEIVVNDESVGKQIHHQILAGESFRVQEDGRRNNG